MRAMITTLKILERDDGALYKNMAVLPEKLVSGILSICEKYYFDICITEAPGVFFTLFKAKGGRKPIFTPEDLEGFDPEYYVKFRTRLQEEGILLLPANRWYMSVAHTEEDIDKTLEIIEKVIAELEEL